MFVYLLRKYISTFLLLLFAIPLFSQETEKVFQGTESLESNRAIRKGRPLFLGGGFDYLFPLSPKLIFHTLNNSDKGIVVRSKSTPVSLNDFSFILNPYFIMGTDFPYILGVTIPISMDIYTKLGFNFVTIGYTYSSSNEFLGYKSFDINGDVNIRFVFILDQYSNLGMYVTSSIGLAYPIFRGYGYFKDSMPFFLSDDSNYSNIIDDSDGRLSNVNFYTGISTGFVIDKITGRNIKFLIGYTMKFFLSDEINDNKQINFNNNGEITSFGIDDYSIHHGIQLEFIYFPD